MPLIYLFVGKPSDDGQLNIYSNGHIGSGKAIRRITFYDMMERDMHTGAARMIRVNGNLKRFIFYIFNKFSLERAKIPLGGPQKGRDPLGAKKYI